MKSFLGLDQVSADVETSELRTDGCEDFHWRIRMTPPATRRFSLSPYTLNREVIVKLSCRRLPSTLVSFREFLNSRCPNIEGRAFQLRCSAWPTSPYSVVPVRFSNDLLFGTGLEDRTSETAEMENAAYRNLINGCRQFATECPRREVEFEIKILFKKNVGVGAERR